MVLWTTIDWTKSGFGNEEIVWSPPQSEIAVESADRALVVSLLTNDVAPEWSSLRASSQLQKSASCWCERPFAKAIKNVPAGFFHSSAPILWQHWSLGLPPLLTGGEAAGEHGRAMVVVTDGHYRILDLFVGIPDDDELARLLEDAEDTRMLMQTHHEEPDSLVHALAERSRVRIDRLWRIALNQQLTAMGKTPEHAVTDPVMQNEAFTAGVQLRLGLIAEELQNVYDKDVQLRFGLKLPDDQQRFVVLEQHSATRMSWARCLSPFIVGADVQSIYLDLIEIVWGQRVMSVEPSNSEALAGWIAGHGAGQPFALKIPSPLLAARQEPQLAQVSAVARRHGLGWKDLDEVLGDGPIRQTNVHELASWLMRSGGRPLDLRRPSQTRYLFFRSSADHPYPIRDGEPPGRSITMIRKVQK